jgi:RsiW-degrading membrane proteinase PrsW (M82 family)
MGEASAKFRPPIALYVALAAGGVLLLGHINMTRDIPHAWPMPALHALAAALPAIGLAALAGRGSLLRGSPVPGLTWRQVTLAAAISMAVATWIAVYVESIGGFYAVVLLLVHNGAFEFAQNSEAVFDVIEDADVILTDNELFFAGLITAAVLAPLSEEFAKSLGVRFMMRPGATRAQVFFLGACAGAGFGFLESMLYGLSVIQDQLDDWWLIMLVRGGSTSLHVLCTGLAGLGWWYWSVARRHSVSLALFGTAVAIHAAWNGAFTAIDSRIFVLDTLEDRTIEIIAYIIVSTVSAMMIVAIPLIARRLREPPTPSVANTDLASMHAWLG